MMRFSKTIKTAALAGLVGLGFGAATAIPAMADRTYTRCAGDGQCWHVRCDWDGDDCRRQPVQTGWYGDRGDYDAGYRFERRRYYDPDRDRFYRLHHFDHRSGRWVCDGDSEYCRWSARYW